MSSRNEKNTLLNILDMYKDMPNLWNKNHPEYKNRSLRHDGFRILLGIYKKFDQDATIKTIKKKIENMKTTYLKEVKKVDASKQTGAGSNVYVPSLWYFNALTFLKSTTDPCRPLKDSFENVDNEVSEDISTMLKEDSNKRSTITPINTPKTSTDTTITSKSTTITNKDTKITPTASKKRLQHNSSEFIRAKKPMDEAFSYMKQVTQQKTPLDPDDECSTFGILIARKIRKLSEERRDIMMVKINQLFVDERYNFNQTKSISSDSYTYTSPPQTSSYQQVSSPTENNMPSTAQVHDDYTYSDADDSEYNNMLPVMNNIINEASDKSSSPQMYQVNCSDPMDVEVKEEKIIYLIPNANNTIL